MWYEWWYPKQNTTTWDNMGFEQRLWFIGGIVALLLLAYVAGRLLNRDEYRTKKGKR